MDRIRELRKQRGLSQAKLAVMADMDPATLNRLEQGKGNPNIKTLERVARVLDVRIAELLEDTAPKADAPRLFNGGEEPAARILDEWIEALGARADAAVFRWRRSAREIEERENPTANLAGAMVLLDEVTAAAADTFREMLSLLETVDRELPVEEAAARKARIAALAWGLKGASDAVRDAVEGLRKGIARQRQADEEELRIFMADELGIDLETLQERDDEADERAAMYAADFARLEERIA